MRRALLALAAPLAGLVAGASLAQGVSESEYRGTRLPPSAITAEMRGGAVRLAWSEPEPGEAVMSYRVERSGGDGPAMSVQIKVNAFVDPAPPRGRLTYVVTALSADGRALQSWSAVVEAP